MYIYNIIIIIIIVVTVVVIAVIAVATVDINDVTIELWFVWGDAQVMINDIHGRV